MRVLVAYHTQTGNTQEIAAAIHSEAHALGHTADLKRVRDLKPEELSAYDLVFLGSPCHSSDLAKPVKKLLAKLQPSPGFVLAGFVTFATTPPERGEKERRVHEQWAGKCPKSFERACEEKSIEWRGYFGCQGAPSKLIGMFIHRAIIKDSQEWAEYAAEVRKHPNEKDVGNARAFARRVMGQAG